MDAIAAQADSTKPTLYAHFGDKEALYRATIARETASLRRWVTTAYKEATTESLDQQVRVYVMALFSYAIESPDGFRLIFSAHTAGDARQLRAGLVDVITGRVTDQIRGYLATLDRHPGPSAELLAGVLVGIVGKAAEYTLRPDSADPLAVGELTVRFIMAALAHLDPALMDAIDKAAQSAGAS